MAIVSKAGLAWPVVPRETCQVDALGGEVVVRGMPLSQRLHLSLEDAADGYARVAQILAVSVVDAAGEPLNDAAGWEDFGAVFPFEALRLFGIAKRVNGMDAEDAEKN